jgi:hypothetical protein
MPCPSVPDALPGSSARPQEADRGTTLVIGGCGGESTPRLAGIHAQPCETLGAG